MLNVYDGIDKLVEALEGGKIYLDKWLDERRKSAEKLYKYCPTDNKPHDFIAQDIIDMNVDILCIKCGAVLRWNCVDSHGIPGFMCTRPPEGWYCTRDYDHDGPCAALPKE